MRHATLPRTHVRLPEEVTGYAFDPSYSWWSTIVAEASHNLVANPSFEVINDDDFANEYTVAGTWTELGEGSVIVAYPAVGAAAGRRVARLVGGTGTGTLTYDSSINVTPGEYTFSLAILTTDYPVTVQLAVMDGVTTIARNTHTLQHDGWQRIHLSYQERETDTRELRLTYVNAGSYTVVMYTDAWQFERKAYPTTYLDGDMLGFNDDKPYTSFFWHGAPHLSASSRRANTGAGGRLISWSDHVGFRTTSIVGLEAAPVEQLTQQLGNGKVIHSGMQNQQRDFTITGRIFGRGYVDLKERSKALVSLHRSGNTAGKDQLVLRYQMVDDGKRAVGDPCDIVCVYTDGLQGSINNFYQVSLAVQFRAVQPFPVSTVESSAELTMVQELVANMIVFRDEEGEFFNLGTGDTSGGVVTTVGFLRDGRIVAFGNYTEIAGDMADYGAIWDGTNWTEIAGTDSTITCMDDGFTLGFPLTVGTAGGSVFEYDDLAGTWAELGDGFIGPINDIHRDEFGDIWVAGQFEFADDGVTVYNNVAKWDYEDEAWEQLGEGLTDVGDTIPETLEATAVLAPNDGYVYFGGTFNRGTASSTNTTGVRVIRWNIATQVYEGMHTGLNGAPTDIIEGQDGFIYFVGPFDQDGAEGYNLRGFARWNGYAWEEVYPLMKPGGAFGADGIAQDSEGIFWFYNQVSDPEDDLFIVDGLGNVPFFGWRNGVIFPPYMVDASLRHLAIGPGDRAIHVTDAYVGAGTPTKVPAMTRITYNGSAFAPMVVHLQGLGKVVQVRNYSTGGGVYGRENFSMSAHEQVILRTDTQRSLAYSNQRRNLYSRLLGGASNMAALHLIPGENRISLFVAETDADSEGWLTWHNRYEGIGEDSV